MEENTNPAANAAQTPAVEQQAPATQSATTVVAEQSTVAPAIKKDIFGKESLTILDASINALGELVIVTKPSKSNPKGVHVMRGAQTPSVCRRSAVPNPYALITFISMGGAKLNFNFEERFNGNTWVDPKTKATGITQTKNGAESWIKANGHSIVLSPAAKAVIAAEAAKSIFAQQVFAAPAPVVAKQQKEEDEDNSPL